MGAHMFICVDLHDQVATWGLLERDGATAWREEMICASPLPMKRSVRLPVSMMLRSALMLQGPESQQSWKICTCSFHDGGCDFVHLCRAISVWHSDGAGDLPSALLRTVSDSLDGQRASHLVLAWPLSIGQCSV